MDRRTIINSSGTAAARPRGACAILLACLAILGISLTPCIADQVTLGSGARVEIPAPDGYVRIDGINAKWDELRRVASPSYGRIIIEFGSESDRMALLKGEFPDVGRSFYAVSLHVYEQMHVTGEMFAQVKDAFRSEMPTTGMVGRIKQLMKEPETRLSEHLTQEHEIPTDFKVGEMIPVGTLVEDDKSVTCSFLMQSLLDVEGQGHREAVLATSLATLWVGQRVLLCVYCLSPYEGIEDITWTRDAMSQWKEKIFQANSPVLVPSLAPSAAADSGRAASGRGGTRQGKRFWDWLLVRLVAYAIIGAVLMAIAFIWALVSKTAKRDEEENTPAPTRDKSSDDPEVW